MVAETYVKYKPSDEEIGKRLYHWEVWHGLPDVLWSRVECLDDKGRVIGIGFRYEARREYFWIPPYDGIHNLDGNTLYTVLANNARKNRRAIWISPQEGNLEHAIQKAKEANRIKGKKGKGQE